MTLPSSGLWKPDMIFISVDLPAPLSPSRPSTSPFLRCRSMLRSAVTGPKRLATPSIRRTSGAWLSLVVGVVPCCCSAKALALPHAPDVHVDDHRDEDRDAED